MMTSRAATSAAEGDKKETHSIGHLVKRKVGGGEMRILGCQYLLRTCVKVEIVTDRGKPRGFIRFCVPARAFRSDAVI